MTTSTTRVLGQRITAKPRLAVAVGLRRMKIMERQFSHINDLGKLRMVDVTSKRITRRLAVARCLVVTTADISALEPRDDQIDPILCARIAGVLAAKKTSDLIPLCHTLGLNDVDVELTLEDRGIEVTTTVTATQRTGVEMEALTACAFAALSIVDSLKEMDPLAQIDELELMKKEGGKSGNWGRLVENTTSAPPH
jgi:cyclic pyranopterin phosphate synthase